MDVSSKVEVAAQFCSNTGQQYVSIFSLGARQKNRNLSKISENITYVLKSTKTVGSGRKVKYQEQEKFIVEMVVLKWKTGNPLRKQAAYDLLICEFGHENEADQSEWEKKMNSGHISTNLLQWISRVLSRHRFSIRKELIFQTVPINWLKICVDACGLIRANMHSAGVTQLSNADEMFLQFYPRKPI